MKPIFPVYTTHALLDKYHLRIYKFLSQNAIIVVEITNDTHGYKENIELLEHRNIHPREKYSRFSFVQGKFATRRFFYWKLNKERREKTVVVENGTTIESLAGLTAIRMRVCCSKLRIILNADNINGKTIPEG